MMGDTGGLELLDEIYGLLHWHRSIIVGVNGEHLLRSRAHDPRQPDTELRANMRGVSEITADRGPAVARTIAKGVSGLIQY